MTSHVWKEVKIGTASFVQVNLDGLTHTLKYNEATERQKWLMETLNLVRTQFVLGSLILLNVLFLVIETNAMSLKEAVPTWCVVANRILLAVYLIELLARLYAYRRLFFMSPFNIVDLAVIASDTTLELVALTTGSNGPNLTFFRVLRIARLLRAHKVMKICPLLSGMVHDLSGAFEAVVWGCSILMFFLIIWGILAVHFLQPVIDDLVIDSSILDSCERCPRAFLTVWQANLTLFQTVVAGDSWGALALPVIEYRGWTCIFFMGSWFTLQMMVMNVILAAVVTKASETRQSDLHAVMQIKEQEFMAKSKQLVQICEHLDDDGSGDLTLNELLDGWDTSTHFAATFHDMGIERDDIKTVFMIMDMDGSGSVDFKEFIHHVHKMKTSDTTTLLNFIKYYVLEILRQIKKNEEFMTATNGADLKIAGATVDDPRQCGNVLPNLFEEQQRLQPPDYGVVPKATCNATDISSPFNLVEKDANNMYQNSNAVLEQVRDDLTRAMACVSDVHLKLLQSVERSIKTLAASIGVNNSSLIEAQRPAQAALRHTNEENRVGPAATSSFGGCCSMQLSDRRQLMTRSLQEHSDQARVVSRTT